MRRIGDAYPVLLQRMDEIVDIRVGTYITSIDRVGIDSYFHILLLMFDESVFLEYIHPKRAYMFYVVPFSLRLGLSCYAATQPVVFG